MDFIGEAFPIDIGARGSLFVLLTGDSSRMRPKLDIPMGQPESAGGGRSALVNYFDFYVNDLSNGQDAKSKIESFAKSKTAVDVAPIALPMLVRFRDINDPGTVELVDPEHLDASFGAGVKIVRAKAEITDQPVTLGIERRLPWLKAGFPEKRLFEPQGQAAVSELSPERLLTYGDFRSTPQ